ncbi:MAG: 23S rRNA (adenine(2503)-C(2))-methyltransferase RlmN, partial [Chlamydiia bacterium]|nr:23S rRNA (adenine(2503)-C(2))-methyltransferase RlmN [Chlamydiia bacterium]
SQVGCNMGCVFCETGRMGLLRNLTTAEITAQVFIARHVLGYSFRNIVFMGMGEPLDNWEAVSQAVQVLTDPAGFGFAKNRITISTSGRVDGIYRMLEAGEPYVNLALSINAPNDSLRNRLMPLNRRYDMEAIRKAIEDYCAATQRQVLLAYVLMRDFNDGLEHAEQLAEWVQGLDVKINLIPYNPQSRDRFAAPTEEGLDAFAAYLRSRHLRTLVRHNKGRDIMAACGQLGNLELRRQLAQRKALS